MVSLTYHPHVSPMVSLTYPPMVSPMVSPPSVSLLYPQCISPLVVTLSNGMGNKGVNSLTNPPWYHAGVHAGAPTGVQASILTLSVGS